MLITEIRIKPAPAAGKLLAFASVVFDGVFVVKDLKIISGTHGRFVAMPSRKVSDHCPECHARMALTARYCPDCGREADAGRGDGRLHADVAHPLEPQFRAYLNAAVLEAYRAGVGERAAG